MVFALAAEDAGWDGVFLADHLAFPHDRYEGPEAMDFHDPWITMAGIATRAEELKLASLITPIPRRQPWQLARNLATLDRLSQGRLLLGTGLGIPATNYTPFGRQDDRVTLGQRYDEALEVIDGLWRGEPLNYDGEHFTIDDAALLPAPVQEPRIPIVAGGVWPNKTPIRRSARWMGSPRHGKEPGPFPAIGVSRQPRPCGKYLRTTTISPTSPVRFSSRWTHRTVHPTIWTSAATWEFPGCTPETFENPNTNRIRS